MRIITKGKHRRFSKTIQLKLTGYFLLILLPLVVLSLSGITVSQQIVRKQIEGRTTGALSSMMDYLDLTIQNIDEISTLVATDNALNMLLKHDGQELSPASIYDFKTVMERLSSIRSVNHMISEMSIYHVQSGTLLSSVSGGKKQSNLADQEWARRAIDANGGATFYIPDSKESTKPDAVFRGGNVNFVRLMDLYATQKSGNLLIISVDKNKLLAPLGKLLQTPRSEIMLVSSDLQIVSSSSTVEAMKMESEIRTKGLKSFLNKQDGLFKLSVQSDISKWVLVFMQPESELYSQIGKLKVFTIGILLLSILLAFLFSWLIYTGISAPLKSLLAGMKEIQKGNRYTQIVNTRKDEFGFLMDSFNQMAEKQKYLIEEIYEKQLHLAKSELKFLQSQVNPHFLYNTLDSIYWMSENYGADEISEMVLNLSNFFRLSLKKGNETVTIQETIDHLHHYLRVQQIRFMDHFKVIIDVQEECRQIPILKLLLQPLVENAILHGLEKRVDKGEMRVTIRFSESKVNIIVEDNGIGMSESRLSHIKSKLEKVCFPMGGKSDHGIGEMFGLRNVKARMLLYYGESADLAIDSAPGRGTTVTAVIPLDAVQQLPKVRNAQ